MEWDFLQKVVKDVNMSNHPHINIDICKKVKCNHLEDNYDICKLHIICPVERYSHDGCPCDEDCPYLYLHDLTTVDKRIGYYDTCDDCIWDAGSIFK